MNGTKLQRMMKTFSKEEFKSFGKFIRSPYFNSRSAVIKFYDAVKSGYPDFSTDKFSNKILYASIYKDKKYNDANMRKLSSIMYSLTEEL
jgi:hypothetical protein